MPNDIIRAESGAIQRHEQPPTMLEMIHQAITSGQVPAEKLPGVLSAFFEFQLKVSAVDAEKEYNRDFAAAMMEMPKVVKRGVKDMGPKGAIPYETYEDLDAAIRPIETRYGFARSFSTRVADGKTGVIMTLVLTHRAGHSTTSERYCPLDAGPGRNDIQAAGSGESYGRRYLTKAKWNIVTVGSDDDANTADPITEQQEMEIQDMLSALAMTPNALAKFWEYAETPSRKVSDIQSGNYAKVRQGLAAKIREMERGQR